MAVSLRRTFPITVLKMFPLIQEGTFLGSLFFVGFFYIWLMFAMIFGWCHSLFHLTNGNCKGAPFPQYLVLFLINGSTINLSMVATSFIRDVLYFCIIFRVTIVRVANRFICVCQRKEPTEERGSIGWVSVWKIAHVTAG